MTHGIGVALSASLYRKDTSIWLSGELGAGKTTFVQGLGFGVGLGDIITSPTYALENRYDDVLLHLDLFRLDPKEAKRVVEESEEFLGVRVIEWSERLKEEKELKEENSLYSFNSFPSFNSIEIQFDETSETTRAIEITFTDLTWPTRKEIEEWRKEVKLPQHIARHCDAVGKLGKELAEELIKRGIPCRPEVVKTAGELHDLLRFVDFTPGGGQHIPKAQRADEETQAFWKEFKKSHPGHHEECCTNFLAERGYEDFAEIIRPHGLDAIVDEPESIRTIEQKILFYADKRIKLDQTVSLDERFDDFVVRYTKGKESEWSKTARGRTKAIEEELFGRDIP